MVTRQGRVQGLPSWPGQSSTAEQAVPAQDSVPNAGTKTKRQTQGS